MDVGFIGVGNMGGPMARNLAQAGHSVQVHDIRPEAAEACVAAGCSSVEDPAELVRGNEIVMASLLSEAFLRVARDCLLPGARDGQVFVDLGTTPVAETRQMSRELAGKGAALLDIPVSGGPHGAQTCTLRMFAGGDARTFEKVRPVLEILAEPGGLVYCGSSGAGQIVKGVNQLAMGLGTAAYLEAIAYGVRSGVDVEAIRQAVGGDAGWRGDISRLANCVIEGSVESQWVKFPELPYFLDHARDEGLLLPLTGALHAFLDAGRKDLRDNVNRPTASFWRELTTRDPALD